MEPRRSKPVVASTFEQISERSMAARKRELIEPHKGDKRYLRRGVHGQFTDKQVEVGSSLAADRRSKSSTVAKPGQGDRGDRRPSSR
jgi:hypothetical protein